MPILVSDASLNVACCTKGQSFVLLGLNLMPIGFGADTLKVIFNCKASHVLIWEYCGDVRVRSYKFSKEEARKLYIRLVRSGFKKSF